MLTEEELREFLREPAHQLQGAETDRIPQRAAEDQCRQDSAPRVARRSACTQAHRDATRRRRGDSRSGARPGRTAGFKKRPTRLRRRDPPALSRRCMRRAAAGKLTRLGEQRRGRAGAAASCSTSFRATCFAATPRAFADRSAGARRHGRRAAQGFDSTSSARTARISSICRSSIRKSSPTRSAASRSIQAAGDERRPEMGGAARRHHPPLRPLSAPQCRARPRRPRRRSRRFSTAAASPGNSRDDVLRDQAGSSRMTDDRLPRRLSLSGVADRPRTAASHRCAGRLCDRSDRGRRAWPDAARLDRRVRLSRPRATRSRWCRPPIEAAGKRVPVIAGVASTATADAVAQARAIRRSAPTAFSRFSKPISRSRTRRSKAISAPSPTPSTFRSCSTPIRNFQRSDLTLDVIARLAEHPRIRYIKDASTNTGRLLSIMQSLRRN